MEKNGVCERGVEGGEVRLCGMPYGMIRLRTKFELMKNYFYGMEKGISRGIVVLWLRYRKSGYFH